MKFTVAVEYGYYEEDDTYHGLISEEVTVEVEDESRAGAAALSMIQEKLGRDTLTGGQVLSITKQ